ncbi:MAG: hypothetical protein IKF39_09040 [Oscillospiraceae bacterium]|nr:hypothetical protein [Oscillospiraceae bacterium]
MKIAIDINGKTRKTDFSWQEGIGGDHAWQFHRSDMVDQLRFAHEELGIRSVRFHGIFDDDMWTVSDLNAFSPMPGGRNVRDWNFRQIGHVYDNLLSVGVKPFVEMSFMPSQLAKKNATGLHYRNNTSIPKDWDEWADYIRSFIRFLLHRYGADEVRQWRFEVWNEPDLRGGFFSGTQKDYFKLYEVTARAVKDVDAGLQVGGPSTSACKWIDEFLAYCRENRVPIDFVSTHHYPGDAFGNMITPSNYLQIFRTMKEAVKKRSDLTETLGKMFFYPDKAARVTKDALTRMDDELCAKVNELPVYMTEWNSMAIFAAPIHDEKYSAAFALKSVLDLDNRFSGYFFWCLSDLFEEQIQLNKPFVGGFGILTNDGIPKPNFWAFKILSQLYPDRIDVGFREFGEVEYAAFRRGNSVQVAVYAQSNDPCLSQRHDVEIVLNGKAHAVWQERIDDDHCNPKRIWKEMGSPENLTKDEVKDIMIRSALKKEEVPYSLSEDETVIRTELTTNDIAFFTIELEE